MRPLELINFVAIQTPANIGSVATDGALRLRQRLLYDGLRASPAASTWLAARKNDQRIAIVPAAKGALVVDFDEKQFNLIGPYFVNVPGCAGTRGGSSTV